MQCDRNSAENSVAFINDVMISLAKTGVFVLCGKTICKSFAVSVAFRTQIERNDDSIFYLTFAWLLTTTNSIRFNKMMVEVSNRYAKSRFGLPLEILLSMKMCLCKKSRCKLRFYCVECGHFRRLSS